MLELRADDKVLFLDIPSPTELVPLARCLPAGCLVALGSRDQVDEARRILAEFDNAMFIDASPEEIPWREYFFTKVVVPPHFEPLTSRAAAEVHRVLAPGGKIISQIEFA